MNSKALKVSSIIVLIIPGRQKTQYERQVLTVVKKLCRINNNLQTFLSTHTNRMRPDYNVPLKQTYRDLQFI